MSSNFCKILISYHKPSTLLKDEVFTPIQTGREDFTQALKNGEISQKDYDFMLKNTIGDNTGDNISYQAKQLCEMTTFYWAWKNYDKIGNPDYIGFMHYRRFFLFNDISEYPINDNKCVVKFDFIDDKFYSAMNYTPSKLKELLKNLDFACINPQDFGITNYEHFKKYHNIKELDYCLDIIKQEYPEIYPYAIDYMNSKLAYYCNMFIMKKQIFFDYCAFTFNIGKKFLDNTDFTYYSNVDARTFVLERITGIYLYYLMHKDNLKYRTFPIAFIKYPELQEDIAPTFKKNNIPIVFTADDDYIKYIGVAIQSIISNSSSENNYDIYILTAQISESDIEKLQYMIKTHDNFSIKIIDFNKQAYLHKLDVSIITNESRFSRGTFYRLLIPEIFKNFEKVLYLDSDLVAMQDIANLYKTEIGKNLIGATYDIELIRNLYPTNEKSNMLLNNIKNVLLLDEPYSYFQAGVLIFNITEMRKYNFYQKSIDFLQQHPNVPNMDQDVLNAICKNKITYFDVSWNCEWHTVFFSENLNKTLPAIFYKHYKNARENPNIIHYSSVWKPWKEPNRPLAHYFWHYAKQSPFYEQILFENTNSVSNINNITNNNLAIPNDLKEAIKMTINMKLYKRKLLRYKISSKITFGKMRKKYKSKRIAMEEKLERVKKLF